MPEVVHELLAPESAIRKLGARSISAEDVAQLLRNPHATIRNPRDPGGAASSSGERTAVGL